MDSYVHETEQAWAGPTYMQEEERARHMKRSGVSGVGNGAAQGGLSLCERILHTRGLDRKRCPDVSCAVMQPDVRTLVARYPN
jgi:hypothetical protein